jgi:hypothetical protein
MIPGKVATTDDIHGLTLGQFYVVQYGEKVQKIYVQPAWLAAETAVKVAKGEAEVPAFSREDLEEIAIVARTTEIRDGPVESPIQRLARENAQGVLSGLDPMTRMANLIVDQQKRLDDLQHDLEGFGAYMGKEAKGNDERFANLSDRLGALTQEVKKLGQQYGPLLAIPTGRGDGPLTLEVNDPARIVEVSETLEPLKVDTYSLRGQVAKLIEEGAFSDGRFFSWKGLQEKLLSQFGSAAEKWDQESIGRELKDLAAPPFRLFYLASNSMYRIRKRKK